MTVGLKPDAEAIRRFLVELKAQAWLGSARAWWPDHLFRTDHVEAAASILNTGKVLSRAKAQSLGVMGYDSASPGVIGKTADRWKQFVRLYFRPRSPTQYSSEGFRPIAHYKYESHCPMPVVFVFEACPILTRADSLFSDGNLASNAQVGADASFLAGIPFRSVYHDSAIDPAMRQTIIFRRHAEVIVPDEMDLGALRFVGCRTQAEYQTLLHLLTPHAAGTWSNRIGLGAKLNLHYRHWNYVDEAKLDSTKCVFQFNPTCKIRGPFDVHFEVAEEAIGKRYVRENLATNLEQSLSIGLGNLEHPERYVVQLKLDGRIAYAGRYAIDDLPF